jgi:3-oxoacyl-[acyl-carrier protein] reductase
MTAPRSEEGCALVTGASRGIGAATARTLARDGWPVLVNYREHRAQAEAVVSEIEADGGRAHAVRCDVTDPAAAAALVVLAEEQLGSVLVLVNNAGVTADGLAMSLTEERWQSVIDLNLTAAFRLIRLALGRMISSRFGRVVNIASVVGPRANVGQANYAASKAGLIGLTKTAAAEVARRGVTVNAVAPGFIATDLTQDVPDTLLHAVPARRAGTPQEVAECVGFLASERAAYVTGTTLYVDGGLSA